MAITDNAAATGNLVANNSTNVTSYPSSACTPNANDLIVWAFGVTDSTVAGTLSDTQSLGWDRLVTNYPLTLSTPRAHLSVAQTLAAASSMTITFDCTGDAGSGIHMSGRRIAGGRSTAPFYRQFASATGAGGTTPAVTFDNPCNTLNGVLGWVFNLTNPTGITIPSGWAGSVDSGHASPDEGMLYGRRLSGETGTTITWGSTSATEWVAVAVEIYVSGQPTTKPFYFRENVLKRRG